MLDKAQIYVVFWTPPSMELFYNYFSIIMQIRGKHKWQLIWITWAWHFEMFRITESLFLATLPSLFNLRETTMTWSLAFLGTSFWFWEKMSNVFVIIITVTINNSKLKVAGHCKRLVFSYSFPKGWHLSQKYFLIKLILLLTLTGTLINHKVEEWRKKVIWKALTTMSPTSPRTLAIKMGDMLPGAEYISSRFIHFWLF